MFDQTVVVFSSYKRRTGRGTRPYGGRETARPRTEARLHGVLRTDVQGERFESQLKGRVETEQSSL